MAVVTWFALGLKDWGYYHSNGGARSDEIATRSNLLVLAFALTMLLGPLAIAGVAFAGRMYWTGGVYLVLAMGLAVVAVPLAVGSYRMLNPPEPVPTRSVCQEHSGDGGNACPGG